MYQGSNWQDLTPPCQATRDKKKRVRAGDERGQLRITLPKYEMFTTGAESWASNMIMTHSKPQRAALVGMAKAEGARLLRDGNHGNPAGTLYIVYGRRW